MSDYAGDISPRQAWEMLQSDPKAVLVDVRTPPEWAYVGQPDLRPELPVRPNVGLQAGARPFGADLQFTAVFAGLWTDERLLVRSQYGRSDQSHRGGYEWKQRSITTNIDGSGSHTSPWHCHPFLPGRGRPTQMNSTRASPKSR